MGLHGLVYSELYLCVPHVKSFHFCTNISHLICLKGFTTVIHSVLVKLPTIVDRLLWTTQCFRTDYILFVSGFTIFVIPSC
jgi:hypothetical protein